MALYVTKDDLLEEYEKLKEIYNKKGLMVDTEENFLAGQIVEIECLLYNFFEVKKQFFN